MMKKLLLQLLIVITFVLTILHGVWAGSATRPIPGDNVYALEFAWTASGGTVPAETYGDDRTEQLWSGYIIRVVTNPGDTAPTDDYDITITDAEGCDVMGGELANRDTSTSEQAVPKIGSAYGGAYVEGQLTLNVSGNSVGSATGKVVIYIERTRR